MTSHSAEPTLESFNAKFVPQSKYYCYSFSGGSTPQRRIKTLPLAYFNPPPPTPSPLPLPDPLKMELGCSDPDTEKQVKEASIKCVAQKSHIKRKRTGFGTVYTLELLLSAFQDTNGFLVRASIFSFVF